MAGDFVASDMIYSGKLISSEDAAERNLLHGVGPIDDIEQTARAQLEILMGLAPDAFAESKRMRSGRICAAVREQMSARVARQTEIWSGEEAQKRLHETAERLARRD